MYVHVGFRYSDIKMFKFNSSHKNTANNQTDKDLKEEGNRLFSYKQYEKAIECYNKAIVSSIQIIFL